MNLDDVRARAATLKRSPFQDATTAVALLLLYATPLPVAVGAFLGCACLVDELWNASGGLAVFAGTAALAGMCAAVFFVPFYLFGAVAAACSNAASPHSARVWHCAKVSATVAAGIGGLLAVALLH